ncbi:15333_t:CDS:2, partial [Entrophospora sp. SA101]
CPSRKLQKLSDEFKKKILYNHPSVPCAYCSMLMMRAAVKWIDYDLDKTYDIMIAFPDLQLPLHVNNRGQTKIAVCSSCKSTKNHHFPPTLVVIPEEIIAVPMKHQKHLSPIHMSCSLGQASRSKVQAPLVLATFLIPEPGKEAQLPKLRMLAEIVFKFLNISDLKCAF